MKAHEHPVPKAWDSDGEYTIEEYLDYIINYDIVVAWSDCSSPRWLQTGGGQQSTVYCDDIEQAYALQELVESWGISDEWIEMQAPVQHDWDAFLDNIEGATDWRSHDQTADAYEYYMRNRHVYSEHSASQDELLFHLDALKWHERHGLEMD